jgi:hypothetical protein
MPFAKGRAKTGGRPKGQPNKITTAAKTVVAEAASRLGGVDRLVQWAKESPENEKAFWVSIFPKLIPLTEGGGNYILAIDPTVYKL